MPTVSFWHYERLTLEDSPAPQPKITSIKFVSIKGDANITFTLAIDGDNFGSDKSMTAVRFTTKDPAHPAEVDSVASVTPTEILVDAHAASNTEITKITLTIGRQSIAAPENLTISIKPNAPVPQSSTLKEFQIKLDHETSKEFPNLHTLIVTKQSGDGGFGSQINHIALDLVPVGATALKIEQINDEQLDLSFVAAADYAPKSLSVTVYDSSDLDKRAPIATAKPAPEKTDTNQPKIDHIETVFLDRSQGNGRIRIFGQGFGNYAPPPLPPDDFLRCDLERPYFHSPPNPQAHEVDLLRKDEQRQEAERQSDPACKSVRAHKTELEDWSAKIRSDVQAGVSSREDALDVQRIEILYIDDKLVDLYFEFSRYRGYSEPFRLQSATLSIRKRPTSTTQTVKTDKVTGEITMPVETSYALTQTIGPQPNPNLTYTYSVLDRTSASTLFGAGVAHNFYVIKLSITNNASKKVSVPLASIQAEVEWARGVVYRKSNYKIDYVEGPPTLSPVPLAAVSAYFSSDYKVTGARARFFNTIDGITTLAAAVVPFAGPSFKIGNAVFTAGFVPGLHKLIGDLSDQQLQTLTGQSWQTSETIAANGGSIDKFVYIQRREQFADEPVTYSGDSGTGPVQKETKKKLTNILRLEVTGFEITDATAGAATPSTPPSPQQKPSTAAAPTTPASGTAGEAGTASPSPAKGTKGKPAK